MEDLTNERTRQTMGQESTSSDSPHAATRRVAAVSCPALSAARLTLPGVMDADGRVDESRLRMHIFKNGGVSASERALVWHFLFGMYPCSSTALERSLLQEQLVVRYRVMKKKWQHVLPSAVRMHLNGTDAELVAAVRYFDHRQVQGQQQTQDQSEEVKDRLTFLELQAQILFERFTFDNEELLEAIRIIDKDVPRTNRDLSYYQSVKVILMYNSVGTLGQRIGFRQLKRMIDIKRQTQSDSLFRTTSFDVDSDVSYAQGMNDLCSRFLEVLDSEVDTFWSFSCYMEKFAKDFRADGLHRKIELEAALLNELDAQLYAHLATDNMESFTFCHRWLLLGFQREFEHSDALRLFEILSCDHLELISQQVDRARYQERLSRKYSTEDSSESELQVINTDFTFELFICAAILIENRESLLQCRDDVQLIQFTSSLQGTLDLNSTLKKAEILFYNYCKRCAWDYMNVHCRTHKRKEEDFLYQLRSLFVLK
ncbi:TBC1 domain family member 15 GTPase-activating protein RAB7 [Channa argus]|uniref:TBC1 domain family member 15 GTPase-activating protein RAB7 n=1 Tax=Channa argus TaxID=215402 RepID=A0A6G1PND5_CHAAH|nr:TBC1 domain family member 15 GTPase-activating protein RAB7 [Channa argus]